MTDRTEVITSLKCDSEFIDMLTGLPTKKCAELKFPELINDSEEVLVIVVDVDSLGVINATLGYEAGDALLVEVAYRLTENIRRNDRLIRLGSDKFCVFAKDATDDLAQRIVEVFHIPFSYQNKDMVITVSAGVVSYPSDGKTLFELLRLADLAIHEAKSSGKNRVTYYHSTIEDRITGRMDMLNKLRRALANDEFLLHYQPQIKASNKTVIGVEALMRWQPTGLPVVPPIVFIPMLEETGLIVHVGEWLIRTSCKQQVIWKNMGYPVHMSVNISSLQFRAKGFYEMVMDILEETGMDPHYLCIELTEGIIMYNLDDTMSMLKKIRAAGISLSIDDFGTGYSSLSYLGKMPISELKIDKSFIREIPHGDGSLAIIQAIVSMAHCLNIRIVVEGVETSDQLNYLKESGCSIFQGYHFSKPLPIEQATDYIKNHF